MQRLNNKPNKLTVTLLHEQASLVLISSGLSHDYWDINKCDMTQLSFA